MRREPGVTISGMSESGIARATQRRVLLERFCNALQPLLGPRISVEAWGGTWLVVALDHGSGGSTAFRVAPCLPSLTVRRHLLQTARNAAEGVVGLVAEDLGGIAGIGPTSPSVAAVGDVVTIRYLGTTGEPLPAIELPLVGLRG